MFEGGEEYLQYAPITKKEIKMDFNDKQSQPVKTDPKKPKTDINVNVKDKREHVYTNAVQSNLASAMDHERTYVAPVSQPIEQASPVKSSNPT